MIEDKFPTLRKYQTAITMIAIIVGIIFSVRFKEGLISKKEAMFWTSIIVLVPASIELVMSILTKESIAKGVFISKGNSPINYIVSVIITLLLCVMALIGVFYYW